MGSYLTDGYVWFNHVLKYLDTSDLASASIACTEMYMKSYETLQERHSEYMKSEAYVDSVVTKINNTGRLIQEMNLSCQLATNMMFDYVMTCYENWSLLIEHKGKLRVPKNKLFANFLSEHSLDIDKIIPEVKFHYTHVHRPTKSYAFYKSFV